eukprot:8406469-Alexandrium_andersonii.AAC.1
MSRHGSQRRRQTKVVRSEIRAGDLHPRAGQGYPVGRIPGDVSPEVHGALTLLLKAAFPPSVSGCAAPSASCCRPWRRRSTRFHGTQL